MNAAIVAIAEVVKDTLNGATLSLSFDAVRRYIPHYALEDYDTLRVTVIPREESMAALSRGADDFDYVIDVSLHKRITATTEDEINAEVDPYMYLAQEIVDLFRGVTLTFDDTPYSDLNNAPCVGIERRPIYAAIILDENNIFLSVIRLTFRLDRAR